MLQLTMKCSWFLLLVFYVTFICCFICSEARWHSHTKHKHIHHHKVSSIAEPPTRPPEPADLFPETPISPVVVSPTSSRKHYNPSPEPPTSAAVTPPTSPPADLFPESPTSSVVVSPTSSPKHPNPSPEPPSSAAVTSPTSPSADSSPETPTSPVVVSPTSSPKHSILSPEPPTSAAVISPTSPPKPSDPTREPPTSPVVPSPTGPPEPSDPYGTAYNATGIFNVLKFGAVGDGATDDTDAFKMVWDAACQVDSAVILVPKDHKFMIQSTIFTGPCQGSLVFQVDGTLMPPDGPDSWPQKNSRRQWLVFYRINGMSLLGGGVIDGRGQKWWDLPCKPHKGANKTSGPCDSPTAIRFFMSSNLTVRGLRIKDSPQFNFRFDGCRNVHIESLHITAPALSPNTDGIHIENTNDVRIYNSVVSNGDDCVSIGAGCYDVGIKNVTCGPSHGISIGSLGKSNSRACVSNITVRDSTIKISDNGVRIKTWQGGSGVVSGITFSNIHMDNVRNPIIIDQFYCLSKDCLNQTSAVHVSEILYENIKGTYDVRSPPMHFGCSDNVPCTNLTLADIELLPANGEIILDPFCWNAYGESQTLTIPPVACLEEGSPGEILDDDMDHC